MISRFFSGHVAYLKDSEAFRKIVETFGDEVVGEDGEINRKVLGPKVFSSKVRIKTVSQIHDSVDTALSFGYAFDWLDCRKILSS